MTDILIGLDTGISNKIGNNAQSVCANEIWQALSLKQPVILQDGAQFGSCFAVSELAACSIGAVASAITNLKKETNLS